MISKKTVSLKTLHMLVAGVAALTLALPALASAASYAYVDQSGYVRSVSADSPSSAMVIAQSISSHSGVMLLNSFNESILGYHVPGM